MLDPAPAQPLPAGLLARVDILTPNENEALMLLGRPPARVSRDEAPELAEALRKLGPRSVVLKLGDRGSYCCGDTGCFLTPAFPVEVRDTTAAGDTFNAALAVALAEGQPMERAVLFANAAAGISVTRLGAQASAPTRAEVDRFLSVEEQG
jgi:ribokinase